MIAFVPARCGSKSIPFKNVKLFCGKPLIYWVLNELHLTSAITQIVVATDCDKIRFIVEEFNFAKVVIYMRELENASDTSSSESVMLEYINVANIPLEEYFILAQITSPFTTALNLSEAIDYFFNNKFDSLLSCAISKRFYWNRLGFPLNYDYKTRPRRQEFQGQLIENGAFYISTVKGILESENRIHGNIGIYIMPEYTSIEIDEPDDWPIAELFFSKYRKQLDFREVKLFFTDVDGTLTDAGMYYDNLGNELKKFNTHDGKGIELLRLYGVKTGIITSENTNIVNLRASKLRVDFLFQGKSDKGKLEKILEACKIEKIAIENVAYIGDDINCLDLLRNVGLAACPADAQEEIQAIPGILRMNKNGGQGAVREFINFIIKNHLRQDTIV